MFLTNKRKVLSFAGVGEKPVIDRLRRLTLVISSRAGHTLSFTSHIPETDTPGEVLVGNLSLPLLSHGVCA